MAGDYQTPQDLIDAHLRRVRSCGDHAIIVKHKTPVGSVYVQHVIRCGSRFCYECSRRKASDWQRKIIGSFRRSHCIMMTLTFDLRAPDPLGHPSYYSKTWDTFVKKLRRRYPSLRYARMVELHKSGRPHFHCLINVYIPQRYLSWSWSQSGGGPIVDIRYVDAGRAVSYVTKYVSKSFNGDATAAQFFFLSRMRSISVSRDLYYNIPRVRTAVPFEFGDPESTYNTLCEVARVYGLMHGGILIADPRSPPFVWIANPGSHVFHDHPRSYFPLTYSHLIAWSYHINDLDPDDPRYAYNKHAMSVCEIASLQADLPLK